jgi:hypothetical protein
MVEVYGMYGGGLRDVWWRFTGCMVEVYGMQWWRFTGYGGGLRDMAGIRLNYKLFLAMVEVYGMHREQIRHVWWKKLFLISPPYNIYSYVLYRA